MSMVFISKTNISTWEMWYVCMVVMCVRQVENGALTCFEMETWVAVLDRPVFFGVGPSASDMCFCLLMSLGGTAR